MKRGRLKYESSGTAVPVTYAFADLGIDDIRGQIQFETFPADRNVGLAESSGDYILETITGRAVPIVLVDDAGTFRCANPLETRRQLAASGELGRTPGEVLSLHYHAAFPILRHPDRGLH